jgi:prephenate dehydratase
MCNGRTRVDGADTILAYLGPRHSFTHLAAKPLLDRPGWVGLACEAADDVVARVRKGQADYGFLAAATNLAGTVSSHRTQIEQGGLVVLEQRDYRARIACAARPGVRLDQVVHLWSHEHPLLECARWLAAHLPTAERTAVRSSSEAARRAAGDPLPAAALCSSAAAADHGLEIILLDVSDPPGDLTRFVLLGQPGAVPPGRDLEQQAADRTR